MPGIDHLKNALSEVHAYHDTALCSYCREIAATIADSLETTIETDAAVAEIVRRHPLAQGLESTRNSLHETRDYALSKTSVPAEEHRPGPVGGLVAPIREGVREMRKTIPRPRSLLPW